MKLNNFGKYHINDMNDNEQGKYNLLFEFLMTLKLYCFPIIYK